MCMRTVVYVCGGTSCVCVCDSEMSNSFGFFVADGRCSFEMVTRDGKTLYEDVAGSLAISSGINSMGKCPQSIRRMQISLKN